jgi:hypothetical protein
MTSDSKAKTPKTLGIVAGICAIGGGILYLASCKPEPPPPETQYQHEAETNALILQDGSTATGPMRYISKSTGQVFTADLGEHITLETTTQETELYTVVINADGALEREIKDDK